MTNRNIVSLDDGNQYLVEMHTRRNSLMLYFRGSFDIGRIFDTFIDTKEKEKNISVFGSFIGPVSALHGVEVPEQEFFESKLSGTEYKYRNKTKRLMIGMYYETYLSMSDEPFILRSPCAYQSYIDYHKYNAAGREYQFGEWAI